MSESKVITVRDAVGLVRDGATVVIGGSGAGHALPQRFIDELATVYEAEGRPRDLTTVRVVGIGDFADRGFSQLGLPGLMRRTIGSNISNEPRLAEPVVVAGEPCGALARRRTRAQAHALDAQAGDTSPVEAAVAGDAPRVVVARSARTRRRRAHTHAAAHVARRRRIQTRCRREQRALDALLREQMAERGITLTATRRTAVDTGVERPRVGAADPAHARLPRALGRCSSSRDAVAIGFELAAGVPLRRLRFGCALDFADADCAEAASSSGAA